MAPKSIYPKLHSFRFLGGWPSFWKSRPASDDGNHSDSNASFMLNTKPEVPFTDFYAGKYFANGWIKFDIFLSFTRTACHMGEKSICRMVSYTLTTIQINGGVTF